MAVLNGELAMDGVPLSLSLYANNVPGGFHWLITSSSGIAPARMLQVVVSTWTDHATGIAVGPPNSYTLLAHVADLRSTLLSTDVPPTAFALVRQNASNIVEIGSRIQVVLPGIALGNALAPPSIKSPTGKWYSPSGQTIVIAPDELQNYQTDVVSPAFVSPELWQASTFFIFPYWLGTDPTRASAENQHLFLAGLLFGIAGSAIIGFFQDVTSRYRAWRERTDQANRAVPHDSTQLEEERVLLRELEDVDNLVYKELTKTARLRPIAERREAVIRRLYELNESSPKEPS